MHKNQPLSKEKIANFYEQFENVNQVAKALTQDNHQIAMSNLVGSSLSFVISSLFKKSEKAFLLIFNDKEEAAYYLNDLEQLIDEKTVLFYPDSYRRPYQIEDTDNANVLLRAEVLNRINSQKKPAIIVTYPDALFEQVITKSELKRNTLKLSVGEEVSLDFVNEMLHEYHFKRVDFVTEPGDFAVRGGIIDVFSFSNDNPYRIEFFGDEVESIRTFEIETQLSIEKVKKISIMPNVENKKLEEKRESFLNYISDQTVVFTKDLDLVKHRLDKLFTKAEEAFEKLTGAISQSKPDELFCDGSLITRQLQSFTLVKTGFSAKTNEDIVFSFSTTPQPSFNKQFDLLIENLKENTKKGITNYLFCDNEKQAQRFHEIFENDDNKVTYKTIVAPIYQGFIDYDLKLACYSDHQIFERYHKFRLKSGFTKTST